MRRLLRLKYFNESKLTQSAKHLFDDDYYRRSHTDVSASRFDRFGHFMAHGWREGRNPSPGFITLYYRDKHLQGRPINPLIHYIQEGLARSLDTAPTSEDEFIEVQKSLVQPFFDPVGYPIPSTITGGDPLGHYLRRGWREDVRLISSVSIPEYIEAARYVEQLGVSPLYHFASQQRMMLLGAQRKLSLAAKLDEGGAQRVDQEFTRSVIAKFFDPKFYLSRNRDVHHAKIDPLDHFIEYGWRENRRPNLLFDPAFYLRANPDVRELGINPFVHYHTVGKYNGLAPNPVGTRPYPVMEAPSEADWSTVSLAADVKKARCIVVMPVYKGYNETLAAIYSVLSAPQITPFALHVVDDRSPDIALSAKIAELAARGILSLDANSENLGFVKTCNKALRQFPDQHVVLLNTDAKVSGNWLDRMIAHVDGDPMIETVTPFSNNATIFSYPIVNENNAIELEVDVAAIDRLAAKANSGRCSEVPVGVGFCFLMSVASRAAIGIFDEDAFGKGYGEESDFCVRAAKAGFRNVLAEDVFVYHVGEVSFGCVSGNEPPGQKVLARKHPDYSERIRQHLAADATEIGRIRLDLLRLASAARPKPVVFVYHALTGGILTHVRDETRRLEAGGTSVILVRVGVGNRWSVEIGSGARLPPFTPNLRPLPFAQLREHIADFFRWLDPGVIHIHSFVGFEWQATTGFMALVRDTGAPYHFTLHDYSVVCHRNDLVLASNRYCGLPDVDRCRLCVATDWTYPEAIDPATLRETYARFLEGAERVFAPSKDIADRLHSAGARYAIDVVPHWEQPFLAPNIVAPTDPDLVTVVTIGAIGAHKGSRVILSLAQDAQARDLPIRYHIIGYSDVTDDLAKAGATETGRFAKPEDAMATAAALSPTLVFLPSIWPETYSYTLSMAFALGVLPVVFDIGAPADRIRDKGFGDVLPYALIDDIKVLNDRLIELGLSRKSA